MDYARFNYVAQPEDGISRAGIFPRINDYDKWAIEWGYRPMIGATDEDSDHAMLEELVQKNLPGNPRLWFGDGETNRVNDPRCQTEDLGDDAVKASEYGILNLKREIAALPKWTYDNKDIYNENLKGIYDQIRNQFYRYNNHVLRNIGGYYSNFKTVNESGAIYTPVEKARQKNALAYFERNIFTEPTWLLPEYMNRFTSKPENYTTSIGTGMVSRLLSLIDGLNPEYTADEYLADLTRLTFRNTANPSAYEKALQNTFVESLVSYLNRAGISAKARPYVLQTLQNLKTRTAQYARSGNKSTQAHFANLNDAITRALTIK